jgi:chromosome transmission fidelity protein 8
MIIPITRTPGSNPQKLPPQLAKIGTDEVVLIEFQGSLEVGGAPDGQLVGTLTIDPKTVRSFAILRTFISGAN